MTDGSPARDASSPSAATGAPRDSSAAAGSSAAPAGKRSLKQRMSELAGQYGRIAIYTYFAISILAIIGFSIAIGVGAQPSSATGVLGVIGAGWAAAKVTLPIRLLITLGVTPLIAHVPALLKRRRGA